MYYDESIFFKYQNVKLQIYIDWNTIIVQWVKLTKVQLQWMEQGFRFYYTFLITLIINTYLLIYLFSFLSMILFLSLHNTGMFNIWFCCANQWTGFYMISASVMKRLRAKSRLTKLEINITFTYKPSNLPMTNYRTFHEEPAAVSSLYRLWKKKGNL